MTDELERRLRAALSARAAAVTSRELRDEPAPSRAARPSAPARWWLPLSVGVTAAAVSITAFVLLRPVDPAPAPPGAPASPTEPAPPTQPASPAPRTSPTTPSFTVTAPAGTTPTSSRSFTVQPTPGGTAPRRWPTVAPTPR